MPVPSNFNIMKIHHKILAYVALVLGMTIFSLPVRGENNDQFIVVIDAGHGGKDTGAIDNGVKEKDINLGVAMKLGDMIKKKLKNVKVVYTRDNDTYLTLQERADKANKSKGNLFISIHTNSVDKNNKNRTTVSGASVYALGLHKDANNMAVARRENSVIELEKNYEQKYSGFDPLKDESYIIFEMAQKKNLSQSIKFANEVQKQLVATAGRRDRGVHQAGFWVLWATSMPAVLVELDFICNPNSAKYIGSERGQEQMARAIFNAVEKYNKSQQGLGKINAEVDTEDEEDVITPENVASSTLYAGTPSGERRQHRTETASVNRVNDRSAYATPRRRRSSSSRAVSEQRDLSAQTIVVPEARRPAAPEVEEKKPVAEQKTTDKQTASRSKSAKSKSAKSAAAKATETKHRGKIEKLVSTYKIQILASAEKLKENSARFCGLSPIGMFREGNLYKYTYGESQSKSEIEKLLKEVRKLIPDAFLIQRVSTKK